MLTYGYPRVILTVARKVLQYSNVLFGLGVVENGYNQTAAIDICLPENIEEMETDLLRTAKKMAPSLPFDRADILIIDEMGKEISGTGFDTKVVGRIGLPLVTKEPESPRIKRILVCDLTARSEGNAVGVGLIPLEQLKIMRVKNTSLISDVDISQGYENELPQRSDLTIVEETKLMIFDPSGNLEPF